jgi:hemerythrin-like domain-containing protein
MKATEDLVKEHNGIKLMLDILDSISKKMKAGSSVDPEHLFRIVDFLRTFVDKCHHAKEEKVLFPAMKEARIQQSIGSISLILKEHKTGRKYVDGLSKTVDKYAFGNKRLSGGIAQLAQYYISLLRTHIEKEDNVVYPMADELLPEEKQKWMLGEFEKIETEIIGAGKHKEYHGLLEKLKGVYVKP